MRCIAKRRSKAPCSTIWSSLEFWSTARRTRTSSSEDSSKKVERVSRHGILYNIRSFSHTSRACRFSGYPRDIITSNCLFLHLRKFMPTISSGNLTLGAPFENFYLHLHLSNSKQNIDWTTVRCIWKREVYACVRRVEKFFQSISSVTTFRTIAVQSVKVKHVRYLYT